jgi:hypothetical protein
VYENGKNLVTMEILIRPGWASRQTMYIVASILQMMSGVKPEMVFAPKIDQSQNTLHANYRDHDQFGGTRRILPYRRKHNVK